MNIYNIPAGIPFARALAAELLKQHQNTPHELPQTRILLPTRRACRTLREAFLQLTNGAPLLLPRMQPLGDIDDEELTLSLSGAESAALAAIPPALSPLRRRILLSRLVMAAADFSHGPAHAIALADALARLIDRIHTEGLAMEDLPALVPEDFAGHWQITLKFLTVISHEWPKLLHTMGMVDSAQRRSLLMNALTAHWEKHPPQTPVIAAGSTGSIPATARLLKAIAHMPQGAIILPGLDTAMDDDSWDALDDTHPQATLRHLLVALDIQRDAVKMWPHNEVTDTTRLWLATEAMRPAATATAWAALSADKDVVQKSLHNVMRADLTTPQEEAQFIAALFRQTLETPGKCAALITPDRTLARRVAAACRRWDIDIDDSAGQSLPETQMGIFLRLVIRNVLDNFAPGNLLSLLRHSLCVLDTNLDTFELRALRGPKPPPGIEGLRNRVNAPDSKLKDDKQTNTLLNTLDEFFAPLVTLDKTAPFAEILEAHITVAEKIAGDADNLWAGDDGEAAAVFLAELRNHAADMPDMGTDDYLNTLEQLMAAVTVRPRINTHPRLSILGQLEARLIHADLVIMSGLNEGTWPGDPGHDPWMSRPMIKQFGLPAPERHIGLSAHDFVQGFCAPHCVMTRALRAEGAPSVPSRWLQRMDAVLQGCDLAPAILQEHTAPLRTALRALDESTLQKPAARPAPTPPTDRRPRKLSVTQIETWLQDPYSIYARHILRLRKPDELEKQPDFSDRGTFLHEVMEHFITTCRDDIPDNARALLLDTGHNLLAQRADDPGFWDFWWPRFERIAGWAVENERDWREKAKPTALEVKGATEISTPGGTFTLSARADRIDLLPDGDYAIIDYKSGGTYTKGKITSGEVPQLPLEGLIVTEGGFENLPPGTPSYLGYWVMKGGDKPGECIAAQGTLTETIAAAREGLSALVTAFDDPATPYYSLPDPDRPLRFNDYEQLSRLQEWAALGEEAEAA